MRRSCISTLLAVVTSVPVFIVTLVNVPVAHGQVQEIRHQIEQLQQQLDKLVSAEQKSNRVTEIGTQRAQSREPNFVVRLYDISDLFTVAPSYEARKLNDFQLGDQLMFPAPDSGGSPASAGGFGGGGGFFSVPVANLPGEKQHVAAQLGATGGHSGRSDSRTSINDLIDAITKTIAPSSWADVGGEASIARLGNALLVSAEIKSHDQIESLLALFRQRWKTLRTVTLRAYWLWLTEAQLAVLLPERKQDHPAYEIVDDAGWQKRPQPDPKLGIGFNAMLTCYNGQTVHVLAGGQTLSVVDVEATSVKSGDPKTVADTIYRPRLISLQDGAGLQVTPLVSTSGKFVVLDVHSRVAKVFRPPSAAPLAAKAGRNATLGPQDIVAAIDRPVVNTQRLSTTLRVPVDRTVLVGGMTFADENVPQDVNLYLFVRASVQELQDDTVGTTSSQDKPKP